jgi:hypothetical protein
VFHRKLHRFLRAALTPLYRARLGSLDAVGALWSSVPWAGDATEHDLAVYMTFVWLATFDAEAAQRIAPPSEALKSRETVLAMKSYMADAGMLDICAFDAA